jgi:hypothetical protein
MTCTVALAIQNDEKLRTFIELAALEKPITMLEVSDQPMATRGVSLAGKTHCYHLKLLYKHFFDILHDRLMKTMEI